MKSIYSLFYSFALASFLFAAGCSSGGGSGAPAAPIVNTKPGLGRIVVMGDSLAFGEGATKSNVKPTGCLANQFLVSADNIAVSGTTSAEIEQSLNGALSRAPKMIFISAGGNDAITNYYQPGTYPAQQTLDAMTRIFDKALNRGVLVVYLGLSPNLPDADRLPQISQIARAKGVIVVDGMAGLWDNPAFMADQFHPNDTGYEIMCQRIIDAVAPHFP